MQAGGSHKQSRGFTIVELGLVIMVLGILFAISVVGYGNWRERTAKTSVTSDLKQAAVAMNSGRNFGEGYPLALPTSFSPNDQVTVAYRWGNATNFCLEGVSTSVTSVQYHISPSDGEPVAGPCPAGP